MTMMVRMMGDEDVYSVDYEGLGDEDDGWFEDMYSVDYEELGDDDDGDVYSVAWWSYCSGLLSRPTLLRGLLATWGLGGRACGNIKNKTNYSNRVTLTDTDTENIVHIC